VPVIDIHVFLHLPVRHGFDGAEIPVIHRLIGKPVEQAPHVLFIGGLDRPEADGQRILEAVRAGDLFGIQITGFGEINLVGVNHLFFLGLADQFGAVVRMGNLNERLRPFTQGLAHEQRHAVFRDDNVHGFPVRKLEGVLIQRKQDIGFSLSVAAGQGKDAPAVSGKRRAHEQLRDIAGTRGHIALAGVQRDAAGQVHFPRRKNRNHVVVEADGARVHHNILRLKLHQRIQIQPGHQLFGAQHVGGAGLAAKDVFVAVGHGAAFHQVHQRVGKEGRMHAQIFFRGQGLGQRLVKRPDAVRDAASVGNHGGDVGCDFEINVLQRPAREVIGRFGRFDQVMEIRHVHQRVPHRPGNL